MLGFDTSGNIAEVDDPDLDNPDAEARIEQLKAILSEAQSWPELIELKRLGS
jgi:hypothetical protein